MSESTNKTAATEAPISLAQKLVWGLEAVGFDLLSALLRLFPLETTSNFGGWLLRTLGPLTRQQRIVQTNLRIAFPYQDQAWIDAKTRGVWDNVGRSFIELPFVHQIMADADRVEVVGQDALRAIAATGPPTVFVSGHMGNWEIMPATLLKSGIDTMIGYRAANNPYVEERIRRARARYGVTRFAQKGGQNMRRLFKALNDGVSVALLTDQRTEEGVASPFFGRPAMTTPGAVQLALRKAAPVRAMSVQRLPGVRFRVQLHDIIPPPQTGDRDRDVIEMVASVNAAIEAAVRENPEQYFWVHRRWPKATYTESSA